MSLIETLLQNRQSPMDKLMSVMPLIQSLTQDQGGGAGGAVGSYNIDPETGALLPGDPSLITRKGVTLQGGALRSLLDIARESSILPGAQELKQIGQGYRSPAEQEAAYNAYLNGTGNLAAKPGTSWHQKGLAIDAGWWSERPELVNALEAAGWSRFDPNLEPWHWSYGGTG